MLKKVELKPIQETPGDYDRLEGEILKLLREEIYKPLLKILGISPRALYDTTIKNATDDLLDAIQSGRLTYDRGYFRGPLDANLTRELRKIGATWDPSKRLYFLPNAKLSIEVRHAISMSRVKFLEKVEFLNKKLTTFLPAEIAGKLRLEQIFDLALFKIDTKIQSTLKSITVSPTLTPDQRARVAAEYTQNMQLYIKEFTEKEIVELRGKIAENALKGQRYEGIIQEIRKSYGVSENKAKFLARQETSLLMAKFKQVRYQDAGVKRYRWACVKNPKQRTPEAPYKPGEVRYYHGLLDGTEQTWDNPPVINSIGERKHPGQDYNCRCYPIPIAIF